ncbi:unnamed protein product [Adineta steineri]|uniref:DAGKc domain-containing protein n=1 Tax=Adineta steineri TaxID=433720 RepID=A0A814GTJ5_9BILA|nr:unnamed protein product [Adineta steineri]CAF3673729.1 unnamed protein product [Adineta steineri]
MSARARRRRAQPPAVVNCAFGSDSDNDNGNEGQNNVDIGDENHSPSSNQNIDRNNSDLNSDGSYKQAFFTIHNKTVEVIFENNVLSWSDVVGEISQHDASRRISKNITDGNSVRLNDVYAISPIYNNWNWSINLNENIAGTTISTSNSIGLPAVPQSSNLSETSVLRGFQLHSYQTLPDNILQEILIVFQSDDASLIERWFQFLARNIAELTSPRHIFVLCNPYSGPRQTRHVYNTKIKPMLEKAQYKITYIEIGDQCSADDAFEGFEGDFDSIDSLVVMGGDGSVINVINALIRYLAKQNRTRIDFESDLPSISIPICIVPNGTTNIICHTIHGNVDHCTPIMHLIFNHKMKIDMSAVFDIDYKFVTANFSAGAGYPANVLKYFPRYNLHSPKGVIKKSFAKAASKKNLQPIEMEIRYIPAIQNNPLVTRCYRGCPSCTPDGIEKCDNQVLAFDDSHIQEINKRRKSASSNNNNNNRVSSGSRRSFSKQNEVEKNWKTLYHNYLQVAVLTNANLWSFAPQGLSKFGHIGDGLLDLVLIETVNRKEFLRYIKRNGNSKNQHELPFTNIIKVKEIEIELKLPIDNYNNEIINPDNRYDSTPSDNSSNEDISDNENKASGSQRYQPHPPSMPIPEDSRRHRRHHAQINKPTQESVQHVLQTSKSVDPSMFNSKNRQLQQQQSESEMDNSQLEPYGSTKIRRRSGIFQSLKLKKNKIPLPRPSSAQREDPSDDKQQNKNRKTTGGTLRPARSLLNLFSGGNIPSGKMDKSTTDLSRNSLSAGTGRKFSVVSRSSSIDNPQIPDLNTSFQNRKRPCMWNLDFSPYNSSLIRIKCFCRYLPVYGNGLSPDTRIKEINYSCFW